MEGHMNKRTRLTEQGRKEKNDRRSKCRMSFEGVKIDQNLPH